MINAPTPQANVRRSSGERATSLGDIEIFAEVVEAGSMSAAARRLGLAVPVVSKRIQRLEGKLGARLLERSTRRLALTEAGEGFHRRIGRVLDAFEEAVGFAAEVSSSLSGTLRVSAPTAFARMHLAPHLPRFLEAHPCIELDLQLSEADVDVASGGFHVALRIGALADSSLIAKKLAPVHEVLCAAPSYLAKHGEPRTFYDLANHEILAAEPERAWCLSGPDGTQTIPVRGRVRTNSHEVIRETIISGAGIGLQPTWSINQELADGRLRVVLPAYRRHGCAAIFAVYTTRELLPRKARILLEFLAGIYGPRPYWDRNLPSETACAKRSRERVSRERSSTATEV
jgi:DNA-binding transcriptional LysR family regulator